MSPSVELRESTQRMTEPSAPDGGLRTGIYWTEMGPESVQEPLRKLTSRARTRNSIVLPTLTRFAACVRVVALRRMRQR